MAQKNSNFLRIVIPVVVIILGILVVMSQFSKPAKKQQQQQVTTKNTQTPDNDNVVDSNSSAADNTAITESSPPEQDANQVTNPDNTQQQLAAGSDENDGNQAGDGNNAELAINPDDQSSINLQDLHLKAQPKSTFTPLGNLQDPDKSTPALIELTHGAGISQITLRDYYKTLDRDPSNRYQYFDNAPIDRPAIAIRAVTINNQWINTIPHWTISPDGELGVDKQLWKQIDTGIFEAEVVNADDQLIATIHRQFKFGNTDGELLVFQSITNHTDQPLRVQVEQWGPCDLPFVSGGYGDFRRIRFGYLDPRSRSAVLATDGQFLKTKTKVISDAYKADVTLMADQSNGIPNTTNPNLLWPNETSIKKNYTLSWVATTNRYFAFSVQPYLADPENAVDKTFADVAKVSFYIEPKQHENPDGTSWVETRLAHIPKADINNRYVSLRLSSPTQKIEPGKSLNFDLDIYTGPLKKSKLASEQPFKAFNLKELVVYQLSCAWCTFQWLAHLLLDFLRLIEGEIISIGGFGIGVHDWAVSIIILVICVRTVLHPLTKKGQMSMQGFSKKMGALQPEIKKLQEKYKGNPKKLQSEQMKLYKEHNINPAGCLGMAPMFLQMPIWVALYASLYFAIELRQEPAFYGVFQLFGNWSFLADLSRPDMFIDFGGPLAFLSKVPLLKSLTSINILPIFMGVIFYLQQKYMTPPQTTMTSEQASQQKIMKVMMVTLFPLMLYRAPSGLTMYIITSSMIGIAESRYIRSHIDTLDLTKKSPAKSFTKTTKKVTNQAGTGSNKYGKNGGSNSKSQQSKKPRKH